MYAPLCKLFGLQWGDISDETMPLSGYEPATQWSEVLHATSGLLRLPPRAY